VAIEGPAVLENAAGAESLHRLNDRANAHETLVARES